MAKAATSSAKSTRWGLIGLALTRISLGLILLWAFLDKLIGLGFTTCRKAATDAVNVGCPDAWMNGGSPTEGFLSFATSGPFAGMFQNMAGAAWVDWLFMLGLFGLGMALTVGVAVRLSAVLGSLLFLMMWMATLWPAHNPILSDHIVYVFALLAIGAFDKQQVLGAGAWWRKQAIAKKVRWLQ